MLAHEKMGNLNIITLAGVLVIGVLLGGALTFGSGMMMSSHDSMLKEFYAAEVASSMSPSEYAQALSQGKIIATMVDLRSKDAYESGHFAGAINIPVDLLTDSQIIETFQKLPNDPPIVTYCYSGYCMLSRKTGNFLAQNGIYVMHLSAGGLEINRDFADYVIKGKEPGSVPVTNPNTGCPPNSVSGFGC